MLNNYYHFTSQWAVKGDIDAVANLLNTPLNLPLWWPAVYLDVQKKKHKGKTVYELLTKGWLPYTIRWQLKKTVDEYPYRFEIEASGDLKGHGIWTLEQNGEQVNIEYDWKVLATKPLLRLGSFLFKPIFALNHHWAMEQGELSLQMELNRLAVGLSRTEAPTPPLPTFLEATHYEKHLEQKTPQVQTA